MASKNIFAVLSASDDDDHEKETFKQVADRKTSGNH